MLITRGGSVRASANQMSSTSMRRTRTATIVADLAAADAIPTGSFDCFILTQTLQYVYDVRSAASMCIGCWPGGNSSLHIAVGQPDCDEAHSREYWRFTAASARSLFGKFGEESVHVESHGVRADVDCLLDRHGRRGAIHAGARGDGPLLSAADHGRGTAEARACPLAGLLSVAASRRTPGVGKSSKLFTLASGGPTTKLHPAVSRRPL